MYRVVLSETISTSDLPEHYRAEGSWINCGDVDPFELGQYARKDSSGDGWYVVFVYPYSDLEDENGDPMYLAGDGYIGYDQIEDAASELESFTGETPDPEDPYSAFDYISYFGTEESMPDYVGGYGNGATRAEVEQYLKGRGIL